MLWIDSISHGHEGTGISSSCDRFRKYRKNNMVVMDS
jgi:hypothetical protein